MRFLANENFPLKSVHRLRGAGHSVEAVIEDSPGVKDWEVLTRAANESRIVLTFDRDYGKLIYRRRLSVPAGIVYFRFAPATPEEPAEHLLKLLAISSLSLEGNFTVVERGRVRQRPLT
jgi:predicted nuclease of predicted toxin-antitoxin system